VKGNIGHKFAAINQCARAVCSNMNIVKRKLVRPLPDAIQPLTPQEQNELYSTIGLQMATKVVHEALENAGVTASEITAVVSTMHTPFPIPSLSVLLQDTFRWSDDCVHLAVTTMGCAGGGFGLRQGMEHAKRQPRGVVLVLNVEISSVGFRSHVHNMCNKLSWLINNLLFADAASAVCILGSSFVAEGAENQQSNIRMVGGRQRMVPKSADVMYFQWDQSGYHFCTTGAVCNTVTSHAPKFVSDLTQSIFGVSPKALSLAIVHTGGAKIIRSLMDALHLNGSDSEALSWESMSGGNLSSVTVIDMLLKAWPRLMRFEDGSKVAVLGMGPGMFLEGVCLRCDKASNVQELKKRTEKVSIASGRSLL